MFVDLVIHVMSSHTRMHDEEWDELFRTGEETYGKGKVKYVATGEHPQPLFNNQKVYLKGISPMTGAEDLYGIANVIVTFEVERTVAEVLLTHGEYDGTYYSTGTGALGEGNSLQLSIHRDCRWRIRFLRSTFDTPPLQFSGNNQ